METLLNREQRERSFKELMLFDIPQPDGGVKKVDFSTYGERGDLAFAVGDTDSPFEREVYEAYWVAESGIFLQVASAWLEQRTEAERHDDVAKLRELLAGVETVAMPTVYGEGQFGGAKAVHAELDKITTPEGERQQYPTSTHGPSDYFVVDSTSKTGVEMRFGIESNDEFRHCDFTVPSDGLWQVMGGMIGRSYSTEDRVYSARTRFATKEYIETLESVLNYLPQQ